MKKFNLFKMLAVLIVLITSVPQVKAWYYITGDPVGGWAYNAPEGGKMNSDNTITFMAMSTGTYYFKLYCDYDPSSQKAWDNPCGSIHSASGTAYDSSGKESGDCGAMWVKTNEVANITFTVYGSNQVDITVTKCAYYIKYGWGGGAMSWSGDMKSNGDGTYSVMGNYGNATFRYGRKNSDGGADWSDSDQTATVVGSPSTNEYCVFTYTPETHSLEIRKCNSINSTNYIYFDNGNANWAENYMYFVIGRPYKTTDKCSKMYGLIEVSNTKLLYGTVGASWDDATYYAVAGGSSAWDNGTNWNYDALSGWSKHSAPYLGNYNMSSGYNYIVGKLDDSNGTSISLTESGSSASAMNTTQTIKFSISRDGGTTYAEQTSGVTPAQITISAYKFVNGTYNSVTNTSNSSSISVNQTSTYSTSVDAAYTGATSLSYTSMRDGYTYIGWYDAASGGSSVSSPCYPRSTGTIYARFKAHRYTIAFNANDDQYSDAPAATGSTASISNVVYDQDQTLTTNGFSRAGYSFAGWATSPTGAVVYADKASVKNLSYTDNATVTLYAKWTEVDLTFDNNGGKGDGSWSTATNWEPECVPTSKHDVTISAEVTISGSAVANSVEIDEDGKLTIAADGALEVAGSIDNDVPAKIVINSTSSSQGALIFNSTGSTAATVNMTMNAASGKFQFIAIPVSYVDVSSAFAGKGVYTYVWKNSAHDWEQRGYYDGISAYEAVIAKDKGSTSFAGNLVSNNSGFSSGDLSYSADGYGDVYMFGNSWPAPIKHSAMTLSGISSVNILLASNSWDGVISDDIIPALQAYAVVVGSSGGSVTINYDNAVRSVTSGRTTALKAPQRTTTDAQGPISIYVSGNEMQTRIRLYEDATRFSDELDEGWEAYYMEGEGYAGDLYAVGTKKMNVLATSDLEGTIVGFVPGQATDYTISFAGDGKGYYLNDVKMEESTLIEEGNTYEFSSDPSTNATRFVISKTPIAKIPTSVDNVSDGVKARKQLIDGALYIIRDGRIYTTTGALVK